MNAAQLWLAPCLLGLASCATSRVVVESRDGGLVDAATIAKAFADHDVVFLGEIHDSDRGHALQLEVVERLAAHPRPLVISMEMFERDVQGQVDAYLSGVIDEAAFLASTRPWSNYAKHYRPVVEFARARGIPVVAANVPRALAARVSREGVAVAAKDPHAAEATSAPRDAYWHEFQKAIAGDEPGAAAAMGEDVLFRIYVAQCLKDDTMAESIARRLQITTGAGLRPRVVHLCGAFHSDRRYGTVARLAARVPTAKLGVVSMTVRDDPRAPLSYEDRMRGDFVVVVSDGDQESRKAKAEKKEAPKHPVAPAGDPHAAAAKNPHTPPAKDPHEVPASRRTADQKEEEPAERPGLGLMPDYESGGVGMSIASVREGGPAAEAGLESGDTVVRLGGEEVTDARTYMQALNKLRVGQEIEIEILREGKTKKLKAKVGASRR